MADAKRGDRPLSPHLTIYRPQVTSILSSLERISGVALAASCFLGVWWFLAAATGPAYFAYVDGLLTGWLGGLILILSLVALWFHLANGLRYLFWDAGVGFDLATVNRSAIAVGVATLVLTVITLIAAF